MKQIFMKLMVFIVITTACFPQFKEQKALKELLPKIMTHEKTAKWPVQSFYQRKGEWQHIIDSTWGPGTSTSEKLDIFDTYANLIQTKFTLFYRLNLNWDSLKTTLRAMITDNTSKGGFQSIMSHLAWALKDGHSTTWDLEIAHGPLNPGTPLLIIACYAIWDVGHFGACLTTSDDGEIFVFRTTDNHPLGLELGDEIIGYEGVKWTDILNELIDSKIPIHGVAATNEKASNHDLLISAGMNWHLFNTIDIKKYLTGDTLHLLLEPMLQLNVNNLMYAEHLDLPDVPKPNFGQLEVASYGRINNLNIGYIYIYTHWIYADSVKTLNQIFLEAVNNLYDADGLIIDIRCDMGGYLEMNLNAGLDILLNQPTIELEHLQRCSSTDLFSLCEFNPSWWNIGITPNPKTFFDKPIAVLIGPQCGSMGDFTAHRFKNFPNGKFFGKTSKGLMGPIEGYLDFYGEPNYKDWIFYTQVEESYYADQPNQYLTGKDFPVDKDVWFTKEDVVKGDDTVVKEALKWMTNLAYSYNAKINKLITKSDIAITADIKNPNNHSLTITVKILNDSSVIDSLDCSVAANKINQTWNIPLNNEDFYAVTITTRDNEDTTQHTLPKIARFTSAGGVVIDSISIRKQFTNYAVRPFVHNVGNTTTIPNASIKLICNDPWVKSIGNSVASLPNLVPGVSTGISTWCSVSYIDSIFPGYFNFKVEVRSDNFTYWTDSIRVNVLTNVDDEVSLPTAFKLEQNYPNPFNPSTKIGWQSPVGSWQTLKVYDILGNEIETLVNEEKEAGSYEVEFDGEKLSSGIYFYQLKAGEFVSTKKMILLR